MDKVVTGTFGVDHREMEKGVYVADETLVGGHKVVTFDIRLKRPYVMRPLEIEEAHSLEHAVANQLNVLCSSDGKYGHLFRKLYWGPMGCMTGFYLILVEECEGTCSSDNLAELFYDVLNNLEKDPTVPFNSSKECGNCRTLYKELPIRCLAMLKDVVDSLDGGFKEYLRL